jgi:flagellar basal-body rod modification protein FlgD
VSVNSIGTNNNTNNTPSTGISTAAKSMGQDAFLRLLTTQLAHQDPTAPQADGEFIAQLAQFSTLEQLTQMQTTLKRIGAALGVPEESGQQ